MGVVETNDFKRSLRLAPLAVQRLYKIQRQRFAAHWLDPRLHVKRLQGLNDMCSFRVTRRYRVLFYVQDQKAIFFDIDHRKDVYR